MGGVFCLCAVLGAPCAVRCAPGAVRRRIHEAGLGMAVRPLAFLSRRRFLSRKHQHEKLVVFVKGFFTKAGSRAPFHQLILFGACALHKKVTEEAVSIYYVCVHSMYIVVC